MKVLIACESSGRVREAFRKRGHDAWSCDLLPADDGSPFHYTRNALEIIHREQWDLMVGHPPCTFLCNSGVRWLYEGGKKSDPPKFDPDRVDALNDGLDFFKELKNAPIDKIALENPVMHGHAQGVVGKPTQCIQPWWFGDEAFKGTCLWLKNLPPLVATNKLVPPKPGTDEHKRWSAIHRAPPGPDRWKVRSQTFQGIADAMAEQWG